VFTAEKPGTPEEILEHHGTKGMRWGIRKTRAAQTFDKKNPTRQKRNAAIRTARDKVRNAKTISRADQAAALRMTTGEKVALTVLAGTGFLTLPIAAYSTVRVADRRYLEKKA
jgi:hypothetical protein